MKRHFSFSSLELIISILIIYKNIKPNEKITVENSKLDISNEKKVFFNPQDLKTLQSFEEFENLFEGVDIREEESLIRGDVIVKIGGVEIRDTPFSDHKSG